MTGRWPPAGPRPARHHPAAREQDLADLGKAVGDLTDAIGRLAPAILGSRLVQLDASGQAQGQSRVPFQALGIQSYSGNTLTFAAGPLTASAPGPGPGIIRVPPNSFKVFNTRAYAWSVYGGNPGDLVHVEEFALPQPPNAALSPAVSAAFASTGSVPVTSAAAGQVIATAAGTPAAPAPVPAGTYTVNWAVILKGTLAVADDGNFGLYVGNTLIAQSINAENIGLLYTQPPASITVPAGGATVTIRAIANATVASVYEATLTGIGPR